jgi:hypothetical protein
MNNSAWLDQARQVLADVQGLFKTFGHQPDPALKVEVDLHPCPGYLHNDKTIRFCPPIVRSPVDELRWSFYRSIMGCESQEEAIGFYQCALPLIVCHEFAHHLRIRLGLSRESHFQEEQICDRLAVAMVEALPRYAPTLLPLQRYCATMRRRIETKHRLRDGWAFLPSTLEVLNARGSTEAAVRRLIERLRSETRPIDFDSLIMLIPGITEQEITDAREARERARLQVDSDYARDPAEYWHLSLTWLESYLSRSRRPSLETTLNQFLHVNSPRTDEILFTMQDTLEHDRSPNTRVLAAKVLLRYCGSSVAHDLLDIIEAEWNTTPPDANDVSCALLHALAQSWPTDNGLAMQSVARRVLSWLTDSTSESRFVAAFEVAARAGVSATFCQSLIPSSDRVRFALWATDVAAFDELIRSTLESNTPIELLRSLCLGSYAMPSRVSETVLRYPLDARRQALVLELSSRSTDPPGPLLLNRCMSIVRNYRYSETVVSVARTILKRIGHEALLRALPPVGSQAFARAVEELRSYEPCHDDASSHATTTLLSLERLRIETALTDLDPRRSKLLLAKLSRAFLAHGEACELLCSRLPSKQFFEATIFSLLLREARRTTLEVCCAWSPASQRVILNTLGQASFDAPIEDPLWKSLAQQCTRSLNSILMLPDRVARSNAVVNLTTNDVQAPSFEHTALTDEASVLRDTIECRSALIPSLLSPVAKAIVDQLVTFNRSSCVSSGHEDTNEQGFSHHQSITRTMLETIVYLQSVPIFSQLALEHLETLAQATHEQRFEAGEYVFHQGDNGHCMYILLDGSIEIIHTFQEKSLSIKTLRPPAYFGELAIFDPAPRSTHARSAVNSRLLRLDGDALRTVGQQDPSLYESLLRMLARQVRALTQALSKESDRPLDLENGS